MAGLNSIQKKPLSIIIYEGKPVISSFLKEAKKKGFKYKDIAEICGVVPTHISKLANGECKASLELAVKLANLFKVPLDTLIGRTPPETEISPTERKILQTIQGDEELAITVLRSAQDQKLIKEVRGGRQGKKAA